MVEQIFMQYICKNCDCIFLDKDVKGRMTPVKGFYCPECIANGFINPSQPLKKKLSEKQLEVLNKNKFPKRKKSPVSNESNTSSMNGGTDEN